MSKTEWCHRIYFWCQPTQCNVSWGQKMMMGSYNARLIYPIGYSKRRCGATVALIRQPQINPEKRGTRNTEQNIMGRGPIFRFRRKPECPEKTLPRPVWNRQTKFSYNHWLAALVKWKCMSTKPSRLATGVVCHPDTEQNRALQNPLVLPGF